MSAIKLTYFNLRGRGEPARLLLALAGKKYEDKRLPAPWDDVKPWKAEKPLTPWGTVPVLDYDGVVIGQSTAANRFLAKEFGFAGKDNAEQAEADEMVDVIVDLIDEQIRLHFGKDEAGKMKFQEKRVPAVLAKVEARLARKESGNWLVGDSLTWADLYLFHYLTSWAAAIPDLLKPLPHCQKLVEAVQEIPQLKDWITIRPKTAM